MKETPILFSTPMVQAILNGTKTQTRRVVGKMHTAFSLDRQCPYGQVDCLLWVRETHGYSNDGKLYYKADVCSPKYDKPANGWKPSIFLKKVDARIWLQITGIRVERLQDISYTDAKAEGVQKGYCQSYYPDGNPVTIETHQNYETGKQGLINPITSFTSLWCSINGTQSWQANPWVWVIEFKVISKTGKP